MVDPKLPADLFAFLQDVKQPRYEPSLSCAGTVTFLSLDQLKVEFFPMETENSDDPHAGEHGSYMGAGVSLVASCDGYDPVGLLLWLPFDGQYGTWDGEHGTLRVFRPDVDWTAMSKDLPRYINSQWGVEGAEPVSDLAPSSLHAYNAEQFHHPLPDLTEWYEAKWTRRGVVRNGVQLRYSEELRIRIERHSERCVISSQTKKAEKEADWSQSEELSLGADALEGIGPQLERGFWNEPKLSAGRSGGETATYWSISGYRAGKYRTLWRFFEEEAHKRDPVHELGKEFARLANLNLFATDD